jgi:two-component system OmpR family response regulator
VYQAVPQQAAERIAATRVVLVVDVPHGLDAAARAARLVDDFGVTIGQLIPGVVAHRADVYEDSAAGVRPVERQPETGLTVDLTDRRVTIDGRPVKLAYREFALFAHLAARPHQTLSRPTLLQSVWADRAGSRHISNRTVDTHIRRIRAKLDDHASVLTTVRGQGYRFDPSAETRFRSAARPVWQIDAVGTQHRVGT